MDELASTEFRKRFARLTEVTQVTVNGHPIGFWMPLDFSDLPTPQRGAQTEWRANRQTQAQRDELLRKINRR